MMIIKHVPICVNSFFWKGICQTPFCKSKKIPLEFPFDFSIQMRISLRHSLLHGTKWKIPLRHALMHVWKAVCRKADRRGEIFVSRVQWGDWKCSAGSFLQPVADANTSASERASLSPQTSCKLNLLGSLEGVASCLAGSSLISLATPFQYIHQSQFHSVCRGARCTKVLSSRSLSAPK